MKTLSDNPTSQRQETLSEAPERDWRLLTVYLRRLGE